MKKLIEFGRKALFYVRVLSGYEERQIRSYRLQIQQRLQEAQEKKEAIKKVPEQIILSEVRRMVKDMKAMNKELENTEAAINEYFKPLDKEAEAIMKMQLEGEEKTMKHMIQAMQAQALLEKAEAEKVTPAISTDTKEQMQDKPSSSPPAHDVTPAISTDTKEQMQDKLSSSPPAHAESR